MALKFGSSFSIPNNGGRHHSVNIKACQAAPPPAPGDMDSKKTQLKLHKTQLKLDRPSFIKKLDDFSTTFEPIKNANEIITSFMDYEALLPYLIAAAKFILLSAKNKGFAAKLKLIIHKYRATGFIFLIAVAAIFLMRKKTPPAPKPFAGQDEPTN